MKTPPTHLRFIAMLTGAMLANQLVTAQSIWTGTNNITVSTNWSDNLNWSTALAPGGADPVLFTDSGAAAVGTINNVVDGAFGGTIGSLQYGNPNGSHTTLIPAGVTLSFAGALIAGMEVAGDVAGRTNSITGAGGALVANSPGANFIVRQWPVAAASSASRTTLDLSGLGTFTGTFDRLLIGVANTGGGNRSSGRLILARTNTITLGGSEPQLDLGDSAANNGNGSQLFLGQTNAFFMNSITVGRYKERAVTMSFMAGLSSPTLYLRGSDGTSRMNVWNIGYMGNGSATANAQGTVDLSAGSLNAQVDVLAVGRASDYTGASATTGPGTGVLTINAGTLDVNTLRIGYQPRGTSAAATTSGVGTFNINGTALVLVNTALEFGASTGGSGVAGTMGTLNINGGTVITPSLAANFGGSSNVVTINNGTLVVSNAPGSGINRFAMTNGTLTIPAALGGSTVIVTNLALGGSTNKINITAVPPVAGYPAQVPLIKYSGSLAGSFNIGVGTFPASSPAYAGYISNNVANGSIDLVLTAGKPPARSILWSGATDANWDLTTQNWIFSALPTDYNDEDFVRFDDAATGPTAVILNGTLLPSTVTVSNQSKAYSFTGSGNLSGPAGITKDGAATLQIINSGVNDNLGALTILAGAVQVGNGATTGNLGPGNIANNGALTFSRSDGVAVAGVISGGGTLNQSGSGSLTLSGANTYTGNTMVNQGTLQVANASALGATNGGTTVASGATLDFNAFNIGLEPVTVSGAGVGGGGALVNNGAQIFPTVAFVTLTGDTVFGGSGRWDLRSAATGNPNQSSLLTGGQPYKLIKVAANQIGIVGTTVDAALGDVEVQAGVLGLEAAMTGFGNPASKLTIWPGAQLKFFDMTNHLNKQIYIGSDLATASLRSDSGANTVIGPITMTNDCIVTLDGGTTLNLNGGLSGGVLSAAGGGSLAFAGSSSHAGTVLNAGKLTLSGTHSGGITNLATTIFAGSGTNTGFSDLGGTLHPGDANVAGTITLHGLHLQPGADVSMELGSVTTVGGGVNDLIQVNGDLIVNGNNIVINPLALLQEGAGNPYTVVKYTGSLVQNGALTATGPNNYVFAVDTSVPGEIRLVASGGPPVWTGGSATVNDWSDSANWGGINVVGGDFLYFNGNTRLNNNNNTPVDTQYAGLGFTASAGAFVLNGNSINLGGNIVNDSANSQKVLLSFSSGANNTLNGGTGTGSLIIGGGVTNTANLSVLTLGGNGILSNRLVSIDPNTITNTLALVTTNASWTMMDNPTATPVVIPTILDVQAGTFNFGSGASAPQFVSTATAVSRVGVIANALGTLNMANGSITFNNRLNTGAGGNALAAVNQSGGTINIRDIFQGSDSAATAQTIMNITGGLFNVSDVAGAPRNFFLASRGTGIVTVANSGVLNCAVFDVSRNAAGNTLGSVGIVNLNGGTLAVTRVGAATGAAQAGGAPVAIVNFNGGTLKANASSTTWFQGNAASPTLPITAIVKTGGAIIDTFTNNVSINEPMQHDSGLGGTPDGGLTKVGTGTLTLTANNSYTGPTTVNAGTLVVNGAVAASAVTVASGGTLGGNGNCGQNLVVNAGGTVSPGTGVGTLTVTNAIALSGVAYMEVNATSGANDLLRSITGNISYAGTLTVVNLGGLLTNGHSFKLFNAGGGSYAGGFSTLQLPGLGSSQSWNTSQLNVTGTISVVGNPAPPTITSVGAVGANLVISGGNGVTNGVFTLVTSTDVAAAAATWTVVGPGNFDANGNFAVATPIQPGTPVRFFRVRLP